MPILLWPFPTGITPPPVPVRAPTGKVLTLDTVHHYVFGDPPYVGESCNLVLNVGTGPMPGFPVQFYFTDPIGHTQAGDPNFSFLTRTDITEPFPNVGFPATQAFVYTFAEGELDIVGQWSVYVINGGFQSANVTFQVVPIPPFWTKPNP